MLYNNAVWCQMDEFHIDVWDDFKIFKRPSITSSERLKETLFERHTKWCRIQGCTFILGTFLKRSKSVQTVYFMVSVASLIQQYEGEHILAI